MRLLQCILFIATPSPILSASKSEQQIVSYLGVLILLKVIIGIGMILFLISGCRTVIHLLLSLKYKSRDHDFVKDRMAIEMVFSI